MQLLTYLALACLTVGPTPWPPAMAQSGDSSHSSIAVHSNLVSIPVLVKTSSGEIVFSLTSQDFLVTDNGIPQSAKMERSVEALPHAIAFVVQTGGNGRSHLKDYSGLGAVLDALVGNGDHRVAVISFDSKPHLVQDFTSSTDVAAAAISGLPIGDAQVAILDAIRYGIDLLSKQPPEYRRAVVLLSETLDAGSEATLEDSVRALNDSNTAIYAFGFSSTKAAVVHEATKPKRPDGSPYHGDAYAAGGCMSRDPEADPDAHGSRSLQGLDCATDLLPPLRLGRMAFAAATDSLKSNVPQSVARMSGGEYLPFGNAKTLRQQMANIANDLPNYYLLTIHPQSPSPGPHALQVKLKDRPGLRLQARSFYWADVPKEP